MNRAQGTRPRFWGELEDSVEGGLKAGVDGEDVSHALGVEGGILGVRWECEGEESDDMLI